MCCIGAPIVADGGAVPGAISVTGLKVDVPAWRLHQIGESVRDHAERVSRLLAGRRRCRREARPRRRGARPARARWSATLEPGPGGGRHPPGLLRSLRHRPRAARRPRRSGVRPLSADARARMVGRRRGGRSGRLGHRARRPLRGRVHHPVRCVRGLPGGRDERLHDLRRARLHPRGRGGRPGRRAGAGRARALARRLAARRRARRADVRGAARPREGDARAGRARARDRRRHDRLLAAHLAALWSPAEIVMLGPATGAGGAGDGRRAPRASRPTIASPRTSTS